MDRQPAAHAQPAWPDPISSKPTDEVVLLRRRVALLEEELAEHRFIVSDITQRKRAEAELQRSEARLAAAQRIAHVGSWEWRIGSEEVWWSDEQHRILGVQPGEIVPSYTGFLQRVHPDDRDLVERRIEAAVSHNAPYSYQFRIVLPDGGVRSMWTDGQVERDAAGRPVCMWGTCQDITERRRTVEEKRLLERKLQESQKLESLGVMAGGIAHDFNNLLTAIMGNASLIQMQLPAGSPLRDDVEKIVQASQRAADLCQQMLAYSGRGRFVLGSVDLNKLVQEMVGLLNVSLSKKIVLRFELAEGLPPIMADATQIRQVVMNLVLNAAEAVGDRPGLIRVATGVRFLRRALLTDLAPSSDAPEGDYVWLEIADTGCGMDEATRRKIFDPFFTTKFTGRGLGLAAVLGIVRGHKGAIQVESEPERGSLFRLLLPPCREPVRQSLPSRPPELWRGEGTILVADDEDWVRDVAARMLRSLGFRVVEARNGEEALARWQEAPTEIRLVLLDLTMPKLDGEETFRTLHLLQPELPVILMSGFSEHEASGRFAGKGLAGFLAKPFRQEDLAERVQAAFRLNRGPVFPGTSPE